MLKPLPFLRPFYITDGGLPDVGGKLHTWDNNTQNPKPTWQDPLGLNVNTNPIILDSAGAFDCFLEPGLYTMRRTDSLDNVIWERDDIEGQGVEALQIVDDITALKALTPAGPEQALVLGYHSINDGGGGVFIFDPASSLAEDGGVVFIPISGPANGRWIRMVKDEISVRYFGAKGDGVDDKTYFENAIAYAVAANTSNTLVVPISPTSQNYRLVTNPAGLDGSLGQFSLRIDDGAMIDFDVIPTINCDFQAGAYRIFAPGSLDPLFDPKCTFRAGPYPEWWGAVNDNTLDQLIPINAWLNCGATLLFSSSGTYKVSVAPIVPVAVTIIMGGLVTDGITNFIKRGLRLYGGAFIEFVQAFGEELTLENFLDVGDDIRAGLNVGGGDIIAGAVGPGLLQQRVGTGTLSESPAVSTVNTQNTAVSTSGAGVDVLMFKLIPDDSLVAEGDALRFSAGGSIAAGGGQSTWNIFFQEVAFGNILSFPIANEVGGVNPNAWRLVVDVMKRAGSLICIGALTIDMITDAGATSLITASYVITRKNVAAIVTTADKTFRIAGEDVAGTVPITQDYMIVEYIKAKP